MANITYIFISFPFSPSAGIKFEGSTESEKVFRVFGEIAPYPQLTFIPQNHSSKEKIDTRLPRLFLCFLLGQQLKKGTYPFVRACVP